MKTTLNILFLALAAALPLLALVESTGVTFPSTVNALNILSLFVLIGISLLLKKEYGVAPRRLSDRKLKPGQLYHQLKKQASKAKSSPYRLAA